MDVFRLLLQIAKDISDATELSPAIEAGVRGICLATHSCYGEAWLRGSAGESLQLISSWSADASRFEGLRSSRQMARFVKGVGFPGRVWASEKLEVIKDIARETEQTFPYAKLALDLGLRAVVGVPVVSDGDLLAVLMFFGAEPRGEPTPDLEIFSLAADQLGWLLRQKRIEQALRESEERYRQDIGAGKRDHDALVKLHAELETRVRQRTSALAAEINERIRVEEELQRRGAWLESLIRTTQDAVISIDRGGCVALFNGAAERIFGYRAEEIVGHKVNELMAEPYASEHDEYIARYEQTRQSRAIGRIRTVTARRKSGETFPIELSVTEIAVDQDIHYAAFIRDISEKARLQEQLVESERLAAIGTTAAKIGHELANPLNGMSLTIQLLEARLRRGDEPVEAPITATVNRLKNEVSRLSALLENFRSLSRREHFDFQPTTLTAIVGEAIELDLPRYADQGIEVECSFASDLPMITVDIDKMKQVVVNLTKNAAEAISGRGKISIKGSVSDHKVTLTIADSGQGIAPGMNIFEPFFTTKPQGTGIGLAVVQQIIRAHDGTITYASELGKGTTFIITLPRK